MFDSFRIGQDVVSFEDNGTQKPISRVTLYLDDETYYTSGDDTGSEIVADCAHATQEMVDRLLVSLRGFQYHAYKADLANVDPSLELGDAVTVCGVYSVVAQITDNGKGYPTLAAPGQAELEEEYPAPGPMTQEFNRKIAQAYSVISKTAEEIRLEVQNEVEGLSSSFSVALESITARVQGLDSAYTELSVTVDGVTVTDSTGTTRIKGSSVETSTLYVDAAHITGTLTVDQIAMTGAITWNDLSSGVQSTINAAYNSGGVSADQVTVITQNAIATANISANQITTGTLQASSVSLNGIMDVTNGSTLCGCVGALHSQYWGVAIADSTLTNFCYASTGGAKIASGSNEVYVIASGCYSTSAITVASDCRLKNTIKYDMEKYEAVFMSLKPCSYYLNSDKEAKRHWGFIAQDFAEGITAAGFEESEIAALGNDGKYYGIGYTELVPLNAHMIQKIIKALAEAGVTV